MLGISLDRGQSSPSNAGLHRSGGRALLQTRRTGQGGGRPSGPGQVPAVAPDPVAPLGFLWAAGEPRGVRSKRQMLESSIFELRNTVTELEKSLNSTENEDNEWKTRYETQVEWNKQLERQINVLRDKVELIRGNPADKLSLVRTFDKMPVGSLKEVLKQLEEEKKILQNQLKDYELRLEQEAKAYHKVNDERRLYLSEILQVEGPVSAAGSRVLAWRNPGCLPDKQKRTEVFAAQREANHLLHLEKDLITEIFTLK
ncbi:coiled-coil domain-containing protein 169 isoform X3 [Agelaius phoeniceus]|uniref:coiled-coil domain-containing protein 169 isoform X3 n=1 Tax=Agelaius phoeniceus TaxID=39638 RepID=UPI004054D1FE